MFETLKAKLLTAIAGIALVGAAVSGGAIVHAQSNSTQPPAAIQQAGPGEGDEAPEAAGVESPEDDAGLPGGGHADQEGVDVQHEFEGVE